MPYIRTIPPDEAEGILKECCEDDLEKYGYVPEYHQVMSLRPDMIRAWSTFQGTIRSKMRLRRYELVTMAASRAIGCRY